MVQRVAKVVFSTIYHIISPISHFTFRITIYFTTNHCQNRSISGLLCRPGNSKPNTSYRFTIFDTSATALCGTTGISLIKMKQRFPLHLDGDLGCRHDIGMTSWKLHLDGGKQIFSTQAWLRHEFRAFLYPPRSVFARWWLWTWRAWAFGPTPERLPSSKIFSWSARNWIYSREVFVYCSWHSPKWQENTWSSKWFSLTLFQRSWQLYHIEYMEYGCLRQFCLQSALVPSPTVQSRKWPQKVVILWSVETCQWQDCWIQCLFVVLEGCPGDDPVLMIILPFSLPEAPHVVNMFCNHPADSNSTAAACECWANKEILSRNSRATQLQKDVDSCPFQLLLDVSIVVPIEPEGLNDSLWEVEKKHFSMKRMYIIVYIYVCMYVYVCICMCIYIYTYMAPHIYIYK